MDPLSNVLSLLKPRNYLSAGFEAAAPWAIQFPDQQQGIKCVAVISGECWLSVEGMADGVWLKPGDFALLPSGRPFLMASGREVKPVPASEIFDPSRPGRVTRLNDGDAFSSVSSRFGLESQHAGLLLKALPPIVVIRDENGEAGLRWSVERMMQEMREPQPGGFLVLQHLAHMLLVQALRLHLADGAGSVGAGWLLALSDRQLSRAMSAIHDEPGQRWTLEALALVAGMSRSSFAERFRQVVGMAPIDYLARWRMLLACDRLENTDQPVSVIAPALGYESEAAFSTAFKRIVGCSPRRYARDRDPDARPLNERIGMVTGFSLAL